MANNNSSNNSNRGGKNGKNGGFRGVLTLIVWALVLTVAFQYFNAYNNNAANKSTSHEIKYSDMISMIEKDQVKEILFKDSTIYVTPVDGYVFTEEVTSGSKTETKTYTQSKDSGLTLYTVYLSNADLLPLLEAHNVAYTGFYKAEMSPFLMIMIQYILPTIFIVGAFMLVMRLMSKSGGGGFGGIGSVGKANAKVYMEKSTGVTFKDVAGQDEAKESLEEIIDFLHNPGKYTAIGAKLPKGALLVAPPVPARPCWPRPWPARPASPSSPSPVPTSWRCSWAWAPAASVTCSRRPPRSLPALSSSMRSTPSVNPATAAASAAMTSASRR